MHQVALQTAYTQWQHVIDAITSYKVEEGDDIYCLAATAQHLNRCPSPPEILDEVWMVTVEDGVVTAEQVKEFCSSNAGVTLAKLMRAHIGNVFDYLVTIKRFYLKEKTGRNCYVQIAIYTHSSWKRLILNAN
jgi:hypothetical protein